MHQHTNTTQGRPAENDPHEETIVGYDVRLYVHVDVGKRQVARAVIDASTAGDPTLVAGDPADACQAIAVCEDRDAQWPVWEIA